MNQGILFDLDGTLCKMDLEQFNKAYMTGMAEYFQDIVPIEAFVGQVMKSCAFMVSHANPYLFCKNVFMEHFARVFGLNEEQVWNRLVEFYTNVFPQYREFVEPCPENQALITLAKEKGYKIAVASNAIMPLVAIEERVRWAGLDPAQFDFVTGMENMHFCKPNTGFFQEIAKNIDVPAEHCVMLGNDPAEDMPAHEIGMKTFLIGESGGENVDWHGSLEQFGELLAADFPLERLAETETVEGDVAK